MDILNHLDVVGAILLAFGLVLIVLVFAWPTTTRSRAVWIVKTIIAAVIGAITLGLLGRRARASALAAREAYARDEAKTAVLEAAESRNETEAVAALERAREWTRVADAAGERRGTLEERLDRFNKEDE